MTIARGSLCHFAKRPDLRPIASGAPPGSGFRRAFRDSASDPAADPARDSADTGRS